MASKSFLTRSSLLLLFIAVFLIASIHAQVHVHEGIIELYCSNKLVNKLT